MAKQLKFEDLAPIRVIVEIEHGGEILEIPLKTLTYAEWNRLGTDIPMPTPPERGVDKQGRPVFDHNNPDYLKRVEIVGEERIYNRLLASLDIPVPGETHEEKIQALKDMIDVSIMRQLIDTLSNFALKGEARIKHRAETFHPEGVGETEDLLSLGIDAGAV